MNTLGDFDSEKLPLDLSAIATAVRALGENFKGDTLALLTLLRTLESLHREIADGRFQESLPDNRQALYALLRNIEASGGWPYIERMKLRSLLVNFSDESAEEAKSKIKT